MRDGITLFFYKEKHLDFEKKSADHLNVDIEISATHSLNISEICTAEF